MTKMQTVELLKKQLPAFYSADQVIKMINDIEDVNQAYDEDQIEGLIDKIASKVEKVLDNMYIEDFVDTSSAEFSLNGNEIQLDSVDANKDQIAEEVVEAVRNVLLDFFPAPKETA